MRACVVDADAKEAGVSQTRERILQVYATARAQDKQCVALAYSPLHLAPDHPLLEAGTRSLWLRAPAEGPGDLRQPPASVVRSVDPVRVAAPLTDGGMHIHPSPLQADQHAARLLAGQIFLGMIVFENEIKEVGRGKGWGRTALAIDDGRAKQGWPFVLW